MASVVGEEIGEIVGGGAGRSATDVVVGRYAWIVLVVVFLGGVAATLSQYEVPPLMPLLMRAFGVDLAAAGSLIIGPTTVRGSRGSPWGKAATRTASSSDTASAMLSCTSSTWMDVHTCPALR